MASGAELPWPDEPVLCQSCERWVGRGRGLSFTPQGEVDAGPDGAEAPIASPSPEPEAPVASTSPEPEPDTPPGDKRLPRPSRRYRRPRPGPIERRGARELGPPPVPTASVPQAPGTDGSGAGFATGPQGAIEDGEPVATAQPIEHSDPPATTGYGNGATHAPPHARPYRSAPEFDPAPSEPPEPDGAAPESTVPFLALTDEPERPRRRFALGRHRGAGRPGDRGRASATRRGWRGLRRPVLRRPTRAGLVRKLPAILVIAGVLLLLEGALTVLWKEPFSALFASQVQSALGDDLEAREAEAAREAAKGRRNAVEYMRRRAVSLNRELQPGEAVGRLQVKKIDLSTVVVQSTTEPSLTKGPGHYRETPLPGQKGNWTVGIAGHRTTYDAPFRNIDKLERGDEIVFTVPYGRFTYEVEGTKIVDDSETGVFIPKGYDRIALTACHPLYSDAQRIIAYGRLKESKPRGGAALAAERS